MIIVVQKHLLDLYLYPDSAESGRLRVYIFWYNNKANCAIKILSFRPSPSTDKPPTGCLLISQCWKPSVLDRLDFAAVLCFSIDLFDRAWNALKAQGSTTFIVAIISLSPSFRFALQLQDDQNVYLFVRRFTREPGVPFCSAGCMALRTDQSPMITPVKLIQSWYFLFALHVGAIVPYSLYWTSRISLHRGFAFELLLLLTIGHSIRSGISVFISTIVDDGILVLIPIQRSVPRCRHRFISQPAVRSLATGV